MAEAKEPKVIIKQPDEPIAAEVIANAIIQISINMEKALRSGLGKEAIVTLIHAQGGVGKPDIRIVLDNLANLRRDWCTR